VMVVGNIVSDHLFGKVSSKSLIFSGLLIAGSGNFAMSFAGLSTGIVAIIIFMSLRYLGMGMVKMPLTDYGIGNVPKNLTGHASSMFNWGKQMVTVIATNILTMVLSINTARYYAEAGFQGEIIEGSPSYAISAVQAVNDVFLILSLFMAASALLSLLIKEKNKANTLESKGQPALEKN